MSEQLKRIRELNSELLEALKQLIEYPQCLELPARTQSVELKNALAVIAKHTESRNGIKINS